MYIYYDKHVIARWVAMYTRARNEATCFASFGARANKLPLLSVLLIFLPFLLLFLCAFHHPSASFGLKLLLLAASDKLIV